jgi:hypothetical protein
MDFNREARKQEKKLNVNSDEISLRKSFKTRKELFYRSHVDDKNSSNKFT